MATTAGVLYVSCRYMFDDVGAADPEGLYHDRLYITRDTSIASAICAHVAHVLLVPTSTVFLDRIELLSTGFLMVFVRVVDASDRECIYPVRVRTLLNCRVV
jgi:hypothetical protein